MRRHTQYALAFALAFALTAAIGGIGWASDNPYTSTLRGFASAYSDQLVATVTTNTDGSYHYLYTLNFMQSAGDPLTGFSVGNLQNLAYTNAGCNASFTMADSRDSVYWYVNVPVGNTVSFWYDSVYSYKIVNCTADSGLPATGQTLGMDGAVPEPGTLLPFALGLSGLMWKRLKRKG